MIRVTRAYRFSASHRLHLQSLSDSENQRLFGKCNNPFGHGHNYVLEVSVRGPVDERSGQAVDRRALDALVCEQVLNAFDHRYLNKEIPEFERLIPTTENLSIEVARRLKQQWRSVFPGNWPVLDRVRISETPRNRFEVAEAHENK